MGVLVNDDHEEVNCKQKNNQRWDDHDMQAVKSCDNQVPRELATKQKRGDLAADNRNTLNHSVDDAKTVS